MSYRNYVENANDESGVNNVSRLLKLYEECDLCEAHVGVLNLLAMRYIY